MIESGIITFYDVYDLYFIFQKYLVVENQGNP